MTKRISERARWVQVARIPQPNTGNSLDGIIRYHDEAKAILAAFAKVGRVVRAEKDEYGALILKARKA